MKILNMDQAAQEIASLVQKTSGDSVGGGTFAQQLANNFNTPHALGWLHTMGKQGHGKTVAQGLELLGISAAAWQAHARTLGQARGLSSEEVSRLQQERELARAERNWAKADEIRAYLQAHGAAVQDAKVV